MTIRATFVSVVPSPYQRDLFRALSEQPEITLSVCYLEASAPDSPWPEKPLAPYERIMPGFWFPLRGARCHLNWRLPSAESADVFVLNTLMSVTAQSLMRVRLRRRRWVFWGEQLGHRAGVLGVLRRPLHEAAAIAAIGTAAQRDYHARFPEPQSFCIPYYCDLQPFIAAPKTPRRDGDLVFLFCGQMIARKGVDLLLTAFASLQGARLLLVGREADLPGMLAPLPESVRAKITYAGFHSPEELPGLFAQADVFVLPSRHDGWGVVVNQAIGAGLPLLCSDGVGAANDLIETGVNGVRFRAGDVGSLTDAMQRLIERPDLVESWAAASRAKAPDWQPEVGARKWVEALREVLAA
ncbi:MAG TPA: glycosyltransferase family 4 protein [Chthoniobacteraceae bacterium]|jgi:poly(glycerol-phosphate) alpha-glucosyltransferase|nr:glycosyltransferase [Chthoniobacter sp.]HEV7866745.1 glycosyltransferase family 4 protein [Chthoniobacteraceae bacterium]